MPLNEALGMKYTLVITIREQQSTEDMRFTLVFMKLLL
jgi:hypothetical protein